MTSEGQVGGSTEFKSVITTRRRISRDVPFISASSGLDIGSNGGDGLKSGAGTLGQHNLRNAIHGGVDPRDDGLFTGLVRSALQRSSDGDDGCGGGLSGNNADKSSSNNGRKFHDVYVYILKKVVENNKK